MITNDGIKESEGEMLLKMCQETKAMMTLETGLAFGASALVFLHHHATCARGGKHFAVDPNQLTSYRGAALRIIEDAGYASYFKLFNGPSHLEIPRIIELKTSLDCAFIDGWHTFDYTLIDFFLIDKLLRPNGMVALHDMYGPAKQKVLRFILSYRDYEIMKRYRISGQERRVLILKFFVSRMLKRPSLLLSRYHWQYQLSDSSGLIVLRKKSNYEPSYNFYRRF
jgi:predicted O-methyltransferase YrrM